eukprot:1176695-Prorocentrum_minimum.AAC.1
MSRPKGVQSERVGDKIRQQSRHSALFRTIFARGFQAARPIPTLDRVYSTLVDTRAGQSKVLALFVKPQTQRRLHRRSAHISLVSAGGNDVKICWMRTIGPSSPLKRRCRGRWGTTTARYEFRSRPQRARTWLHEGKRDPVLQTSRWALV